MDVDQPADTPQPEAPKDLIDEAIDAIRRINFDGAIESINQNGGKSSESFEENGETAQGELNDELLSELNADLNKELSQELNEKVSQEVNKKMNEKVNEELNEELNVQANEELNVQAKEELNVQANEELNVQANEELNEQANEELNEQVKEELNGEASEEIPPPPPPPPTATPTALRRARFAIPEDDEKHPPSSALKPARRVTRFADDPEGFDGNKKTRFSVLRAEGSPPKNLRVGFLDNDSEHSAKGFGPVKKTRFSIDEDFASEELAAVEKGRKARFSIDEDLSSEIFQSSRNNRLSILSESDSEPFVAKKTRFSNYELAKRTRFSVDDHFDIEASDRSGSDRVSQLKYDDIEVESEDSERSRTERAFDFSQDWIATYIVAFFVVTYWRGAWMLFDNIFRCKPGIGVLGVESTTCFYVNQDQIERRNGAIVSWIVGLFICAIGIAAMWRGYWVPSWTIVSMRRTAMRFSILWTLSTGTVLVWRGIWYLLDYFIATAAVPEMQLVWALTAASVGGSYIIYAGSSLVASPAIFLMDGPSRLPPPIAITVLSSYYSLTMKAGLEPPEKHWMIYVLDTIISFIVLPIFVVTFWRNVWYLMDIYLELSLAYTFGVSIAACLIANDDILNLMPEPSALMVNIIRRTRSLVLAVGSVAFWRFAWYFWDFYATIELWSFWVSYLTGMIVLVLLGCFSSVMAPPATVGNDAAPAEDSADDPLFSSLPLSYETLFLFSIRREPPSEFAVFKIGKLSMSRTSAHVRPSVREGFDKDRAGKQSFFQAQRPGLSMRVENCHYLHQRTIDRRRSTVAFRTR